MYNLAWLSKYVVALGNLETFKIFYQKGKTTPAFKITPNPTPNQPGNGKIEFRQPGGSYKAPTYNELKRTIKNQNFPKRRSEWRRTPLNKANFQTKTAQANLLLEFEVARRSGRGGFLRGTQTNKAISTVTNPRKKSQSYPKQVILRIYTLHLIYVRYRRNLSHLFYHYDLKHWQAIFSKVMSLPATAILGWLLDTMTLNTVHFAVSCRDCTGTFCLFKISRFFVLVKLLSSVYFILVNQQINGHAHENRNRKHQSISKGHCERTFWFSSQASHAKSEWDYNQLCTSVHICATTGKVKSSLLNLI